MSIRALRTGAFACLAAVLAHPIFGAEITYPDPVWQRKSPEDLGVDRSALDQLAERIGGVGCVVRDGWMIYTWGSQTNRADIASAVKPMYSHFLLKSVEEGLLESIDAPLVKTLPEIGQLNRDLGFKDRKTTWRHMAAQTSCYGFREIPGTAFDYNDYQMALFADTMIYRVYGSVIEQATADILRPMLTDPIHCEDDPIMTRTGRMRISVRDLARVGLLYLARGRWENRQVLSPETATFVVSSPLPPGMPRSQGESAEQLPGQRTIGAGRNLEDHMNSYSYGWWLNGIKDDGKRVLPSAPIDTFGAFGHAGRHAVVIVPSKNLVVCWLVGLEKKRPWRYSVDGHNDVEEAMKPLFDSMN